MTHDFIATKNDPRWPVKLSTFVASLVSWRHAVWSSNRQGNQNVALRDGGVGDGKVGSREVA